MSDVHTGPEPQPPDEVHAGTARLRREPRRRFRRVEFKVGKALGTSFSVWWKNSAVFMLFSLVVFVPYGVFSWWLAGLPEDQQKGLSRVDVGIENFFSMLVSAPVIGAVIAELRGRRESFGRTLAQGLARLPSVIGVALATSALLFACAVPVTLAGLRDFGCLVSLIGLATVAAVCFLSIRLYVAIPVAVVERPGIVASLKRSFRLTRGLFGPLFVVVLFFGLITYGLGVAVSGLLATAAAGQYSWLGHALLFAFLASLQAVVSAVVYHDLRLAVEGVDTAQIAAVFD